MGFSRQKYWSRLPFSSPGDLPDPRIEPRSSSLLVDSLPSKPLEKTKILLNNQIIRLQNGRGFLKNIFLLCKIRFVNLLCNAVPCWILIWLVEIGCCVGCSDLYSIFCFNLQMLVFSKWLVTHDIGQNFCLFWIQFISNQKMLPAVAEYLKLIMLRKSYITNQKRLLVRCKSTLATVLKFQLSPFTLRLYDLEKYWEDKTL